MQAGGEGRGVHRFWPLDERGATIHILGSAWMDELEDGKVPLLRRGRRRV